MKVTRIIGFLALSLVLLAVLPASAATPKMKANFQVSPSFYPGNIITLGTTTTVMAYTWLYIDDTNSLETNAKGITSPKGYAVTIEELSSKNKVLKTYKVTGKPNTREFVSYISITKKGPGIYKYRYKAVFQKKVQYSKPFTIEITPADIPNGIMQSDMSQVTTSKELGTLVVGNELLVDFKDTVSAREAVTIIKASGGKAVGRLPEINRYQALVMPGHTLAEFKANLEKSPKVNDVFYNEIMYAQ